MGPSTPEATAEGLIYKVRPDGKTSVVFTSGPVRDRTALVAPDAPLYAGTERTPANSGRGVADPLRAALGHHNESRDVYPIRAGQGFGSDRPGGARRNPRAGSRRAAQPSRGPVEDRREIAAT